MSTPPSYPQPSQPALAYETPQSQWNAVTIGAIALKIMGVYCLIQAVPLVQLLFYLPSMSTRQGYGLTQIFGSFVVYGLHLALAVAFIFFAGPLACWLFRGEQTQAAVLEMPVGPYLQAVAFSIIGVWLSVQALATIAYLVFAYSINARTLDTSNLVDPALKAALGIFLIFRGPGLALFWHKLRTGGTLHDDRK